MRVSFVVPGYAREPIGGIRTVYELANQLVVRGHDVTVVHVARFRRGLGPRDGHLRKQAEEVVSGWRDARRGAPASVGWQRIDPRVQLHYVSRIDAHTVPDGDAVIATAWQTAGPIAGLPAAKGRGNYFVQGYETWNARAERVHETWRLPLRKLFVSRWLLDLATGLGIPDVHTVPLGVDTERFRVVRPVPARGNRVAMLSGTGPWKGLDVGVRALASAKAIVPDLAAVCFGVGARPAHLPTWIAYHRDPAQVDLIDAIYNPAAVYLCPSRTEGWGLPPMEAMACGCALVSTANGGVAEYATDGVTAMLHPVDDADGLAHSIVALCTDPSRRVALAEAGHAHVQRFSWPRAAAAFECALAVSPAASGDPAFAA